KVAEAKSIIDKIDKQENDKQKPIAVGDPILKVYNVPGIAEKMAATLQEVHKASATCRISAAGTSKIIVYATPEDQISISRDILGAGDTSTTKSITLDVGDRDPESVAKTLVGAFGDPKDSKTGAPYVEAITDRNAVLVRGTDEQLADAKDILSALLG